jgi:hypothetical protein
MENKSRIKKEGKEGEEGMERGGVSRRRKRVVKEERAGRPGG